MSSSLCTSLVRSRGDESSVAAEGTPYVHAGFSCSLSKVLFLRVQEEKGRAVTRITCGPPH